MRVWVDHQELLKLCLRRKPSGRRFKEALDKPFYTMLDAILSARLFYALGRPSAPPSALVSDCATAAQLPWFMHF
jgi:hypothetical protein